MSSEWKINKTKLLQNTEHTHTTFKRGTDVPERKTGPLVWLLIQRNLFYLSGRERLDIFQTFWSL